MSNDTITRQDLAFKFVIPLTTRKITQTHSKFQRFQRRYPLGSTFSGVDEKCGLCFLTTEQRTHHLKNTPSSSSLARIPHHQLNHCCCPPLTLVPLCRSATMSSLRQISTDVFVAKSLFTVGGGCAGDLTTSGLHDRLREAVQKHPEALQTPNESSPEQLAEEKVISSSVGFCSRMADCTEICPNSTTSHPKALDCEVADWRASSASA